MNTLALRFSSGVKAELFRLLFGIKILELHVRELERQSGFALSTVRQELKNLVQLGLVQGRRSGNRTYYRANVRHPLYPEIHNLVLKTIGLVELLRDALGHDGIQVAFVFGSIASGVETPKQRYRPDVDWNGDVPPDRHKVGRGLIDFGPGTQSPRINSNRV